MIKTIIFDFDGVICESVQIKTDAFLKLYNKYGNDFQSKVIQYHLENGGVSRYEKIKYINENFLGEKISKDEINFIAEKFSKLVVEKVVKSKFVHGALDYIKSNYKKYNFFISSATPQDEIVEIVKRKNIEKYFIKIFGSPASKVQHIDNIIKINEVKKSEVVFIGDARTDMISAKKTGVNFVARIFELNKNIFSKSKILFSISNLHELDKTINIIESYNLK